MARDMDQEKSSKQSCYCIGIGNDFGPHPPPPLARSEITIISFALFRSILVFLPSVWLVAA
jgi:hypothetical protein